MLKKKTHNKTEFVYVSSYKYTIIYSTSELYANRYIYLNLPKQAQ